MIMKKGRTISGPASEKLKGIDIGSYILFKLDYLHPWVVSR
jgi:hypothetical protein